MHGKHDRRGYTNPRIRTVTVAQYDTARVPVHLRKHTRTGQNLATTTHNPQPTTHNPVCRFKSVKENLNWSRCMCVVGGTIRIRICKRLDRFEH
eukprot:6342898-Pyramimonas_sp.AAC.2